MLLLRKRAEWQVPSLSSNTMAVCSSNNVATPHPRLPSLKYEPFTARDQRLNRKNLRLTVLLCIYKRLGPANEAQCHENLRLDLKRKVEPLNDCVDAERNSAFSHQHREQVLL